MPDPIVRFFLQVWRCIACGGGPFLVLGPMGGHTTCPACGRGFAKDSQKERGQEVSAEMVSKWWHGYLKFCTHCSTANDAANKSCSQCGANEWATPDTKKVSPQLKRLLKKVGIDLDAENGVNLHTVSAILSKPQQQEAIEDKPIPVPVYIRPAISLPAARVKERRPITQFSTLSTRPLQIIGKYLLILVAVVAIVWLIVYALTPVKEQLTVVGYGYELSSGYSYITQDYGSCYSDEGECPNPAMTPEYKSTEMYYPAGSVVIATSEATEISTTSHQECDPSNGTTSETVDLDGLEAEVEYTNTPECEWIEATSIAVNVNEVMATYTPYPRDIIHYSIDVEEHSSISTGFQRNLVPTEQLQYPEVPYAKTPEPSEDNAIFVILLQNEKGEERRWLVSVANWYTYEKGTVYENAQVNRLGIIVDLGQ